MAADDVLFGAGAGALSREFTSDTMEYTFALASPPLGYSASSSNSVMADQLSRTEKHPENKDLQFT